MPDGQIRIPNEFTIDMLREVVDDISETSAAFAVDAASVQVTYIVNAEEQSQDETSWFCHDLCAVILGTAWTDGVKIKRILPLRHPIWPSLFATRIVSLRGIGPMEGIAYEDVDSLDYDLIGWTRWKKYRVTVEFSQPQYEVVHDEQIHAIPETSPDFPRESRRFVETEYESDIEVISLGQGNFVYSENPDGETGVANSKNFNGESIAITPKSTLRVTWRQVPLDFLSLDGGYTYPVTKHVGKVNYGESGTNLFGLPNGTLQLMPVLIRKYKTHVFRTLSDGTLSPQMLCDVTFTFNRFEPKSAISGQTAGFNWFPWRGNQAGRDGVSYLPANRSGELGGGKLFESFDFTKLFRHHVGL